MAEQGFPWYGYLDWIGVGLFVAFMFAIFSGSAWVLAGFMLGGLFLTIDSIVQRKLDQHEVSRHNNPDTP